MSVQVGSAFAEFRLDLDRLRSDIRTAKGLMDDLRKESSGSLLQDQRRSPARATTQPADTLVRAEIAAAAKVEAAQTQASARVSATRLQHEARIATVREQNAGRMAVAETQAAARSEAARLQAEGRIEAARIGAANRTENLERRLAAQAERRSQQGGMFAGITGGGLSGSIASGMLAVAGAMGVATTAAGALSAAMAGLKDGFNLQIQLDQTERSLGRFLGGMERGNEVMRAANAFGREFGFTQREMASGLSAAGRVMRNTGADIEQILSVLARLQYLSPEQGIQGAVIALNELASGDTTSIVRRFEMPREAANALKREIEQGVDPIAALDRALASMGVTNDALRDKMEGASGAQVRYNQAVEAFNLEAQILTSEMWINLLNGVAEALHNVNAALNVGQSIEGFHEQILAGADSYARYREQVEQTNALLPDVLGNIEPLTAAQYSQAMAMQAQGKSAEAAIAPHQALHEEYVRSLGLWEVLKRLATGEPLVPPAPGAHEIGLLAEHGKAYADLSAKRRADQISAKEYADQLKQTFKVGGADTLGIVKGLAKMPDAALHVQALQANVVDLQRRLAEETDPKMVRAVIQQLIAVNEEIARVEANMPVEITVDVQMKLDEAALDYERAVLQRAEQTSRELENLDAQHVKAQEGFAQQQTEVWSNYYEQRRQNADQFYAQRRRQAADFEQQEIKAAQQFAQQQARALRDFQQQAARSERDYLQQRARSLRDFQQGEQRAARDFAQQQARSLKDFQQGEAKSAQDHTRRLHELRARTGEDIARQQADLQRRLLQMDRDFNTERRRDQEDYALERQRLLAEGRIYEAQLLDEQFGREQQRKGEDYATKRGDTVGDGTRQIAERRSQLAEQIAAERQSYAQQRADRQRAFQQQQADALQSYRQQRADAAASFRQQQADALASYRQQRSDALAGFRQQQQDAATAYAQQRTERRRAHEQQRADALAAFTKQQEDLRTNRDKQLATIRAQKDAEELAYKASQTRILTAYDQFVTAQKAKLAQAQADILAVQKVTGSEMERQQTAHRLKMDQARREWNTAMSNLKIDMEKAGVNAGTAYMRTLGQSIISGANYVDRAMQPVSDRMIPRSPIRRGPLANHERGAAKAAQMYVEGWREGLERNAARLDPQLQRMRERLNTTAYMQAQPFSGGTFTPPPGGYPATRARSMTAAQAPQPLQITVPIPPIVMDGQTVGRLAAPHTANVMLGDLSVAVQVVDAAATPGLHQPSFRQLT